VTADFREILIELKAAPPGAEPAFALANLPARA